ncbi:MAG TPA: hypothetical protein PKJ41_19340 [Bryobacteraceae bacterium]|nr:hypothetical protein [Bryobacteraceae bacterium]HPT28264.1 hypothetical protein [Bryobacteraceae bacterium]
MNLSYQEKCILGPLAAMLIVYGNYFAGSMIRWLRGGTEDGEIGRLLGTLALLAVIEVAYQIAMAVIDRPAPKDERDRMIDAKATRNAYGVLAVSIVLVMGHVIFSEALPGLAWPFLLITPFLLVQAMLGALVLAEVVKGVTQLYYYRAGI